MAGKHKLRLWHHNLFTKQDFPWAFTDQTSKLKANNFSIGESLKKHQVEGSFLFSSQRPTLFHPFSREYVSFLKVVSFFSEVIWIILYDFHFLFGWCVLWVFFSTLDLSVGRCFLRMFSFFNVKQVSRSKFNAKVKGKYMNELQNRTRICND